MRSVSVVLPESMWALMPMFLTFSSSFMCSRSPAAPAARCPKPARRAAANSPRESRGRAPRRPRRAGTRMKSAEDKDPRRICQAKFATKDSAAGRAGRACRVLTACGCLGKNAARASTRPRLVPRDLRHGPLHRGSGRVPAGAVDHLLRGKELGAALLYSSHLAVDDFADRTTV